MRLLRRTNAYFLSVLIIAGFSGEASGSANSDAAPRVPSVVEPTVDEQSKSSSTSGSSHFDAERSTTDTPTVAATTERTQTSTTASQALSADPANQGAGSASRIPVSTSESKAEESKGDAVRATVTTSAEPTQAAAGVSARTAERALTSTSEAVSTDASSSRHLVSTSTAGAATTTTTPNAVETTGSQTSTSVPLKAKIIDGALVIGGVGAAAAVAGGVTYAVEHKDDGKTKTDSDTAGHPNTNRRPQDVEDRKVSAFLAKDWQDSSVISTTLSSTAPAVIAGLSSTLQPVSHKQAPAHTIEMFPKFMRDDDTEGQDVVGNFTTSLPAPIWMIVVGLGILGASFLVAGVVHMGCFGRRKRPSRSLERDSPERQPVMEEEHVAELAQQRPSANSDVMEPDTPLLPPLPPLLPRPITPHGSFGVLTSPVAVMPAQLARAAVYAAKPSTTGRVAMAPVMSFNGSSFSTRR
jgi:hypothetical protein